MSSTQTIEFICYPFGMVMPGRNWTAASAEGYRFGFNGKESDDEIKGDGNSLDFGARIYDPRLGKWLTVDPLMANYPNLSPFIYCGNAPIAFYDPDGKEVKNAFFYIIKSAEASLKIAEAHMLELEIKFGSLDKKSNFTGTKDEWKYVKTLKKDYESKIRNVELIKVKEEIVNNIIAEWKQESSILFDHANTMVNEYSETVDLYVSVANIFEKEDAPNDGMIGGYNEIPYFETSVDGKVRPIGLFGVNTQQITFEIDRDDREHFELTTQQNIKNHEYGHFEYMATQTAKYKAYIDKIINDNRSYKGGHNTDDPSGQRANEYGKLKDLPK